MIAAPFRGSSPRRPSPYDRHWVRLQRDVLRRDPVCPCGRPTTQVDHVLALVRGGTRLDPSNCRGLCGRCHRRKTNACEGGFGRPRIMTLADAVRELSLCSRMQLEAVATLALSRCHDTACLELAAFARALKDDKFAAPAWLPLDVCAFCRRPCDSEPCAENPDGFHLSTPL